MFRSMKSCAVCAVVMLSVGLPVLGATSPVGAAALANRCESINGVTLVQSGTAFCFSTPTTGSNPNIAVANGDRSFAFASDGDNNTATATGNDSFATANRGDNNTATAVGANSIADASQGDGNTAIARGGCTAFAISGSNLTVICP